MARNKLAMWQFVEAQDEVRVQGLTILIGYGDFCSVATDSASHNLELALGAGI